MCGRCFCTLQPPVLGKACSYETKVGKFSEVPWHFLGDYNPSPNMGPRDYLPVVASGTHFGSDESRVLVPMLWGMIPFNWADDPKKHNAKTHNARIETIQETLFKQPLAQGCRCVVIAQGYYEWKTTETSKSKQPYFIYPTQKEGVKLEDPSSWKNEWSEENGWEGPAVLKMAGLFRKYKNPKDGETTYSVTIITRESNEVLSWLHHRTPIFLQNAEDEEAWLSYNEISKEMALERIIKLSLLEGILHWHPVSTTVNNVRYKNPDCIMPVKPKEKENEKAKQLMSSWLSGAKRQSEDAKVGSNVSKKLKEQ